MQNTTNFSFLLPEGTDIVNPLTQMNPNWSDLDTALTFFNARINTNAVATKAGTVFNFVRQRPNNTVNFPAFFRFVAPADYNTGDTFTVEGTAKTALTPDGNALQDKCFVTGAVVLAALSGNELYIYVDSKYIPTASEVTSTDGNVQSDIDGIKSDVSSIKRLNYIDVTDTTDSNGRITIGSTYFDDPVYNILSAVPIDSHNNIIVEIGKRYAALDSTVAYLFCKYGLDGAAVPNTEITIRIWYVDAQ